MPYKIRLWTLLLNPNLEHREILRLEREIVVPVFFAFFALSVFSVFSGLEV